MQVKNRIVALVLTAAAAAFAEQNIVREQVCGKTKPASELRTVRPDRKPPFRFTVLNCECVNQAPGQCVVIETPEGKVFAFDTANGNIGDEKNPACRSNGKDILVPFLKKRGYDHLDGLIISHAHIDHFGGFNWLKYNWPVSRLWDNGFMMPGMDPKDYRGELGAYARLRDEFSAENPGAYQVVHAGMKLDWGKDVDVEVIWPPKGGVAILKDRANPKEDTPVHHLVNASSIAVRITYGEVSFFIAGDIQEDYFERSMARQVPPEKLKCDVCVLPAHGIHTTKLEASLTRPKLALIGIGNRTYMYETPKVARRIYEAVGSKVYVSNEVGDITVTTDGKSLDVSTNGRLYPKLTK